MMTAMERRNKSIEISIKMKKIKHTSTIYQKRAGIDEPLNVYRTKDFRVFLILQIEETVMVTLMSIFS